MTLLLLDKGEHTHARRKERRPRLPLFPDKLPLVDGTDDLSLRRAMGGHFALIADYARGRYFRLPERILFRAATRNAVMAELILAFGARRVRPESLISPAALAVCLSLPVLAGMDDPKPTQEIQLSECLTLARGGGRGGRTLIAADPVAAAIVSGRWLMPKEGDEVTAAEGTKATWKSVKANAEGSFQGAGFAGGYAFVNVPSGWCPLDRPLRGPVRRVGTEP